ncbi:MAG: RNA polymerase sigma factor [Burkholderiaceae bacterium]|nr:RNA polymerase sigma factor [Burkholderiaceae bacterium]
MDFRACLFPAAALHRRLETLRPAMYRLAYLWCHDAALADDLTQDALTKAVARLGQLRDPDRLRPWLFGILVNAWRDHLRALRPGEDIDALEETLVCASPTPEQQASQAELVAAMRAAVARLPVGQRQVIALVDLEECGYAETAAILGIPVGTVMSRLHRGRAALRAALAGDAPEALAPHLRLVR